jgi:hypothetical protein
MARTPLAAFFNIPTYRFSIGEDDHPPSSIILLSLQPGIASLEAKAWRKS